MISTAAWVLGWVTTVLAATMLVPALISFGFAEIETGLSFIFSAGLTLFAGIASVMTARGTIIQIDTRTAILTAVLFWPVLALFGAVPFLLSGEVNGLTQAYFESMSGITTSGATILLDVSNSSRGIIIWRALLQWLGGFATIILALSFLSLVGVGGMNLFHSSMPRTERDTATHRFWHAVKSLWWIYLALSFLCGFALGIAGMDPFDAAAHALSTISTGGFSSQTGGISAYGNPNIEGVLVVFMIVGSLNATLYWAAVNGRWRDFLRDGENRYLFTVLLLASLVAVTSLFLFVGHDLQESLRVGIFNVVSALTTTGFSASQTEVNASFPAIFPVLFAALMLLGGACVSTSGGVKQLRLIVFFKLAYRELFKLSHPHGVTTLNYMGKPIDETSLRSTWGFLMTFITLLAVIAMLFGLSGLDLKSTLALTAASISNAGAGLSITAPNLHYADMSISIQWLVIATQVIGRVEVLLFLVFLTPTFWRN